MTEITFHGGVNDIGGNKFIVESKGTKVFMDFGMSFSQEGQFFSQFLGARTSNSLNDMFELWILPKIKGLYRRDYARHMDFDGNEETEIDAVLLTHAHVDHADYISFLHEDIPVYMMYLAVIGANENAILLQREDPWSIDPSRFKGTFLTKEGMEDLCEWLERLKIFTKSDEIYKEQFLEPVRLVAKMMDKFRNMDKRTSDLEGWVFAKSKPSGDSFSDEKKVVVSAVFPKLQSAMTVKVSESVAKEIDSNYFIFGECQPVGLVNRIHQVHTKNRQTQKKVNLSEFDFLFVAFDDIKNLDMSIEMENFCEVESVQSEIKHHLGFPFVSSAEVLQVTGPQVVLKGKGEQKIVKMQISNHYHKNSDNQDPKKFEGKQVRFLGVQWYSPSSKNAVNLEMPEIFLMQEEEDSERLDFENLAGAIRLRGKIGKLEAEKILSKEIPTDDCIEIKEDVARFRYSGSYDRICAEFIQTMSMIRDFREKFKTIAPQMIEEQVIDEKKTNTENIASLIKHYKELYDILLNYQMQFDVSGIYDIDSAFSSLSPLPEGIIKKKIRFLKYLGIFENEKEVKITNKGFKVLTIVSGRDLDAKFSSVSRGIIDLNRIQNEGIPPSLLLEHLRNGKVSGYLPAEIDKKKTEMFWTQGGKVSESEEKLMLNYSEKMNVILEVMRSVSHPTTTQGISENIKEKGYDIGNFTVNLLLNEIEKSSRIRKSDESWEYTIEGRLLDLFMSYPDEMFDLDKIFEKIVIGYNSKKVVLRRLQDMENANVISQIKDKWTLKKNIEEKTESVTEKKVQSKEEENSKNIDRYW